MNAIEARNKKKAYASKKHKPVLAEDYYNMYNIFATNNWNSYPGYIGILQAHADRMCKMNDDQKALYLDLTQRFLWIRDYTKDIIDQLNRILSQFNYKKYYIIRCTPKNDQKKSKSSGVVLYEIKNPEVRKQLVKPINIVETIKDLITVKDISESLLILVDDFVGTGDTAKKCIEDIIKQAPDTSGRTVIMCIAAMEQGINRLSSLHIPVFASYKLNRGISDNYSGYNLNKNRMLMHQLESIFNCSTGFSFGYAQSEALICLKRCPNNTFPIYWHGNKSPYPRY